MQTRSTTCNFSLCSIVQKYITTLTCHVMYVRNVKELTDPGSYKFTIRTKRKWTKNANETNEKWTSASHERYEKRTIHETNARYTNERTKWNERTILKTQTNERTIHERTNHWSVAICYPMTNDPGSIEVQYSIVLLFEWLLCKLIWLTNLILSYMSSCPRGVWLQKVI